MQRLNTLIHRNHLVFACLFLLLSSCDTLVSKYETHKRVNYNPYLNFYKSIDCECKNKEVVSPLLKLIKKTDLYKNEKNKETIVASMDAASIPKNIYIKYDFNQCGIITFSSNDLVIVKGQMYFESSTTLSNR